MHFRPLAVAAAVLSLLPAAQAQSSLQLYGVVDLSFGSFQYSGTEGSTDNTRQSKVDGNQMVTSYIGFKGLEDLGGGLSAGFVIEAFLRPDTGAAGRNDTTSTARADPFWGRASNVYLKGASAPCPWGAWPTCPSCRRLPTTLSVAPSVCRPPYA